MKNWDYNSQGLTAAAAVIIAIAVAIVTAGAGAAAVGAMGFGVAGAGDITLSVLAETLLGIGFRIGRVGWICAHANS